MKELNVVRKNKKLISRLWISQGMRYNKKRRMTMYVSCYITAQRIGAITDTEMNKSSYKLTQLKIFALEKQVDLICLTETNTDWRVVPPDNHL